jgi:hypothetical protein
MSAPAPAAVRGSLPAHPSLENLRNQARTLQKQHHRGAPGAAERVAAVVPEAALPLRLHDAQFVLAREYGFASWPRLVNHLQSAEPARRVRREGSRVWIDGVPRLRWGASPEPTFIGALEAAFRASDRPLDLTTLLGDSGLAFRLRWATRDGGQSWCGSGPCGEWPEEVEALNAATGYVYEWDPHAPGQPLPPHRIQRIVDHIDNGWPVLGFGANFDVAVIFGYEDGGQRVLLSDYWATEEPSVMAVGAAKEISAFMLRIDPPAPRPQAVRAGLALALQRWHQGIVDPDPITGATYYYGSAAYERWLADLQRHDSLGEAQRANLFHLNGWTWSSLAMNRSGHAAKYLRDGAQHLPAAAHAPLEAAAACHDRARERIGRWDPADPAFGFVKQKRLDTWTPEVREREQALLRDLYALDTQAMGFIGQALAHAQPQPPR